MQGSRGGYPQEQAELNDQETAHRKSGRIGGGVKTAKAGKTWGHPVGRTTEQNKACWITESEWTGRRVAEDNLKRGGVTTTQKVAKEGVGSLEKKKRHDPRLQKGKP